LPLIILSLEYTLLGNSVEKEVDDVACGDTVPIAGCENDRFTKALAKDFEPHP
jgi:hypothetical protein